jgi:hypothetical protein
VFWTIPVPQRAVTVDFEDTIARLRVRRLTVFDDHDLANSLTSGLGLPGDLGFSFPKISPVAPVQATVSFDIGWSGNLGEAKIHNASQGFQGSFRQTTAAMSWSAEQEAFRFESDAANTSISVFAVIGSERNGIFFSG